jgi:transposase-like protein
MAAQVSKDTISRITDRVVEEMQGWTSRPLERVDPAAVLDAINVKVATARSPTGPSMQRSGSTWKATRIS